jgi:hypothetical protein
MTRKPRNEFCKAQVIVAIITVWLIIDRRKIDIRLLPILGALYTISLVDRTNISAARISGIDTDLKLAVGNRASIARKFINNFM